MSLGTDTEPCGYEPTVSVFPFTQCKTFGDLFFFFELGKTLITRVERERHSDPTVHAHACACPCVYVVVGNINEDLRRATERERVRGGENGLILRRVRH